VVEKTEELSTGDLVHHFCTQIYGSEAETEGAEADLPREILVPELPADVDALSDWLSGLRRARVTLRVPQRGDKKTLLETVARNAGEALTHHKLKRASDLSARSRALEEIADGLGLREAPLRIECYDVSQIQGTDVVASMVVFEDGLARKSEYRRFIVTGATDDVSAISEVLRRRFARYLAARSSGELTDTDRPAIDPETGRARKFAYAPNLVVVDGGAPQVNAAGAVLRELGIGDIAVCGLAKRLEEVWQPDEAFPVILPRTSEGLYLLQRVRDEAHRFAITFHRERRSKRMTASVLDEISGLGEVRRKALLRKFGSLRKLGAATVEEILEVPGIGRRTAEAIVAALNDEAPTKTEAPARTDEAPKGETEAETTSEAEMTSEAETTTADEPDPGGESPTPGHPDQAAT
jgi:excinuclease ABC subunit C